MFQQTPPFTRATIETRTFSFVDETRRLFNTGLMLPHYLRPWSNIKPALCQHLVLTALRSIGPTSLS